MKIITSRNNPLIKKIKELLVEKGKVFLLEGKKLVEEAILSNAEIKFIFVTEKFEKENREFIEKLEGYELIKISEHVEKSLSTVESSQGILGVAFPRKFERTPISKDSVLLYLYKIKDPGNLGTIFRSAEAFGVDRIYISSNACSPFNTKVIRASAGSCLRVPFFEEITFENLIEEIKNAHGKIYATSSKKGTPPWRINWTKISCIVVGSEPEGLPQNILSLSDDVISIPQFKGESLNVAISTSIILYEIIKSKLKH
ncbi:MAG: TrmH family RNA methyltransferase [Candidatus Aminicenantia bacterium]